MFVFVCLFHNKECSNYTYGLQCTLTCGKCNNDQHCHHVTGACPQRCVQGYHGEKCDTSNAFFSLVCNLQYFGCCLFPSLCFFLHVFISGLKKLYAIKNKQVGIAFYGLLAPNIVSVLCNAWCLMRSVPKIIAIFLSFKAT